ncbi:MAG: CHAD domain-containing protein [Rhodomicrobium sp.]|nr:CHAD domain-containing protein [Rhodomicrobium sp.]
MHYRLSVAQPLKDAVPAIAGGQLDAAIARLKSAHRDHTAVHAARKHFKRARALLVLVEPAARGKKVKAGQELITSAARMLAASRDAQVAASAAEELKKEFGAGSRARAFSDLISFLKARSSQAGEKLNHAGLITVLDEIEKAKASLSKLDLRGAQMSDLLDAASGSYRRGRRAMKPALETGSSEALHSWRKLVQRHWRHMLLLQEVWPEDAKRRIALARHLSDTLGSYNDLSVLRGTILGNTGVLGSPSDMKMLCRCIGKKKEQLLSKAASRGERLYAEKPKAFASRLRACCALRVGGTCCC